MAALLELKADLGHRDNNGLTPLLALIGSDRATKTSEVLLSRKVPN